MIEGAFVSLGLEDFFFECIANMHIIIPIIIIIRMMNPLVVPPMTAPVLLVVATKMIKYCYMLLVDYSEGTCHLHYKNSRFQTTFRCMVTSVLLNNRLSQLRYITFSG